MEPGSDTTAWCAVEPGSCFLGSTNLVNIALAFGGAIGILVYCAASFSGMCPFPSDLLQGCRRFISQSKESCRVVSCVLKGSAVYNIFKNLCDHFCCRWSSQSGSHSCLPCDCKSVSCASAALHHLPVLGRVYGICARAGGAPPQTCNCMTPALCPAQQYMRQTKA